MIILNELSTYRSALMGVAMISVFCFHGISSWAPEWIYNICKNGDSGVDIFLFLSAIGLCYSFDRNPDVLAFYKRRLLRIFPTYWFIMTCIWGFCMSLMAIGKMPDNYIELPHSVWEALQAYTTLGYWIPNGLWFRWYIPAIIPLYLLFPLWFALLKKCKWIGVLSIVPSFLIAHVSMHFEWYQWLLVYRIGIFLFGACCYPLVKEAKQLIYGSKLKSVALNLPVLFIVFGGAIWIYYIIRAELKLTTMPYQPLEDALFYVMMPGLLLAICQVCKFKYVNVCLSFIGTISLEFYLIHEFIIRFTLTLSNSYLHIGRGSQLVMAFFVSLILAYTTHCMMNIKNVTHKH